MPPVLGEIVEGGPADRAGLQKGDRILAIDGQAVGDFRDILAGITPRAGESVLMPIVFYVDPKIREEQATRTIDEITLSYTFYPVEKPESSR